MRLFCTFHAVSPRAASSSTDRGGAAASDNKDEDQPEMVDPDVVDMKHAVLDDAIVGVDQIISDEIGPGAREPMPLASQQALTPARLATHVLTQLTPHPGCPTCKARRTPNTAHLASHESERVMHLVVGNYIFLRSTGGEVLQTCLPMRLYPYKVILACAAPKK